MKIIFLGDIRSIVNKKEEELRVGESETIRTLLSRLSGKLGEQFKNIIFDSSEELHPDIIVQHNGENIVTKDGLETEIRNNDTIVVTRAVAGG